MKVKTKELTDILLDYAIARIFDVDIKIILDGNIYPNIIRYIPAGSSFGLVNFTPSKDWHIAGPYLDYAEIEYRRVKDGYVARVYLEEPDGLSHEVFGEDHLISGLRAIVLNASGEEVEIPDELVYKSNTLSIGG